MWWLLLRESCSKITSRQGFILSNLKDYNFKHSICKLQHYFSTQSCRGVKAEPHLWSQLSLSVTASQLVSLLWTTQGHVVSVNIMLNASTQNVLLPSFEAHYRCQKEIYKPTNVDLQTTRAWRTINLHEHQKGRVRSQAAGLTLSKPTWVHSSITPFIFFTANKED